MDQLGSDNPHTSQSFIQPLLLLLWMFLGCVSHAHTNFAGLILRRFHGCIFSKKSMTIKFYLIDDHS